LEREPEVTLEPEIGTGLTKNLKKEQDLEPELELGTIF